MPQIRPFGTDPVLAEWQGFVDGTPKLITRSAWQCVLTRTGVGAFQLAIPIWMDDDETLVQVDFFSASKIATKITFLPISDPNKGQATLQMFYATTGVVVGTTVLTPGTGLYGIGGALDNTTFNANFGVATGVFTNIEFIHPANAAAVVSQINTAVSTIGGHLFSEFATASVGPSGGIVLTAIGSPVSFNITVGSPDALTILGITPGNYATGAPVDPMSIWNLKVIQCSDYVSAIEGPFYP